MAIDDGRVFGRNTAAFSVQEVSMNGMGEPKTVPQEAVLDDRPLRSWLEHHLQGAIAAQELARALRDDEDTPDIVRVYLARFLGDLHEESAYLRCALARVSPKGLVEQGIGMVEGVARRVVRAVPNLDRPTPFEGIEALAVGVWGKRLLWRALQQLDGFDDRNRDIPFPLLVKQALDQERALVAFRDDMLRSSLFRVHPAETGRADAS